MKKFSIISLAFALIASTAAAQAPDTLWTNTFGDIYIDEGHSVYQVRDGGYIIAGHTRSYGVGMCDVYLIRANDTGGIVWTKTFGGSGFDYGESVQQTADGGYIIAGYTDSYGAGNYDVNLIKTNGAGDSLWMRTFGGSSIDQAFSVQQTPDEGYIIAGYTYSFGANIFDVYLIKTDAVGNEEWYRTFGGGDYSKGCEVQITSDGGYIIVGYTKSPITNWDDVYLIKTDANGDSLWTRTYGGSYNDDYGFSVQQASDGGYIITGRTGIYGGQQLYLIKTDSVGNEEWARGYGGSLTGECGNSVRQTSDGGYIIAGYTSAFSPNFTDVWVVKTDAEGDSMWTIALGGNGDENALSVQQCQDGGYIITGFTSSYGSGESDVYLIRLEAQPINLTLTPHNLPIQIPPGGGNFQFDIEIINSDTINAYTIDTFIDITLPSGFSYPILWREDMNLPAGANIIREDLTQLVPGSALAGDYSYNVYILDHFSWEILVWDYFPFEKLPGDGAPAHNFGWTLNGWDGEEAPTIAAPIKFALYPAYPNPFNPETIIGFELQAASCVKLLIYDIQGREVARLVNGFKPAGMYEVVFDGAELASGVYFARLEAGEFRQTRKILLVK